MMKLDEKPYVNQKQRQSNYHPNHIMHQNQKQEQKQLNIL